MMRILLLIFVSTIYAFGQDPVAGITESITLPDARAHISFLASDELKGRNTGTPEIDIAARYIASYFERWNLLPAVGDTSYFQTIAMVQYTPPTTLTLALGGQTFKENESAIFFRGDTKRDLKDVPAVFVGYGTPDDLKGVDVTNKIVVCLMGMQSDSNPVQALLIDTHEKAKRISEAGGLALVEIAAFPALPFKALANFLNKPRMMLAAGHEKLPHIIIKPSELDIVKELKDKKTVAGSLHYNGADQRPVAGRNVAGLIPGSDPTLKDEYIVLSAHYDHVGVGKPDAKNDSIYNGARDNATGTVGIMLAAKYLSQHPPKRSVIFLGLAAEEQGLLGSLWYADHPLIPLEKTVFNFNCDGAGYNDTTTASVIGLSRTNIDPALEKACQAFGLKLGGDVAPEQKLYERSDNYSFAAKGVPAVNISPGVKAFDQELMKYYHQPADHAGSLNFTYLTTFYRTFVYASSLIANYDSPIRWTPGDKFEGAGKKLYGK